MKHNVLAILVSFMFLSFGTVHLLQVYVDFHVGLYILNCIYACRIMNILVHHKAAKYNNNSKGTVNMKKLQQ